MKTISAISIFVSIRCLPAVPLVSAFTSTSTSTSLHRTKSLSSFAVSSATSAVADNTKDAIDNADKPWASHALLFSSLSDGIIPNNGARSFLRYSLVNALLSEKITQSEDSLESSVKFSPCNGPDIQSLNSLENIDELYNGGQRFSSDDFVDDTNDNKVDSWATKSLKYLLSDEMKEDINVRVLYIPTASYALNPNSSNTPGKQRQRARADGKKRRTQLLNLLDEVLSSSSINEDESQFKLLATTLDLDDGSLKQPVGSDDTSLFPKQDKEALSTWRPHVIYVEGGNTFWLQHCIEKGDYATPIRDACTSSGTVYCGKSAGAIVAGKRVVTATWKGWDDPSVVEGKGTYDDWLDCQGFEFAGEQSIFPHMGDDWNNLVNEKVESQNLGESVNCLREEDACCVIGNKNVSFVTSGPAPTE